MRSITLKIKKRPFPTLMLFWIVALPFLWGTFFDLFHLPSILKYTADFSWIVLLGYTFAGLRARLDKKLLPVLLLIFGFFIYCVVLYLLNYQSAFYFLWGFRNNFRYYVLFYAATIFLTADDVDGIYSFMDFMFWVNAVVTLIQFFLFGYKQDYLGGIFGVIPGCNAMTIIFFFIVLGRSLLKYMEKKERFWLCFSKCAVALIIAALAELKFFFVIFVLLLGMATLITSFSWRKLFFYALGLVLVVLGSSMLTSLFDFENFMSFENIWNVATQEHYSTQKTVNRLSAIPTLARSVVNDPFDRIFGMGLGNCDTSAFEICNTPFYKTYGFMRYTYFSCAFLFLEVGYIGLVAYMLFFAVCFIQLRKLLKQSANSIDAKLAIMMCVLAVILVFYNSSLRAEIGYLVYLVLAIPFIRENREDDYKGLIPN